jgi:UDP-N-acetylglucosamine transferase subunit ALG13
VTEPGSGRSATRARRLRLCLAASGGGHLRQLLDLEPVWSRHDAFFVSENTALSRSLASRHPFSFVPHAALGQGRLGAPLKMLAAGVANLFGSLAIVLRRRPQVVISTGAGSAFFTVMWAKLLGAKIIVIESFARFDAPSAFARFAGPIADFKVVQSPALAKFWPDAEVFDPLRLLEGRRPAKQALLFATVGATLPFERMVRSLAELAARGLVSESIVLQTGEGGTAPAGMETHETLPLEEMIALMRRAEIVVCHGGTGSIITALREGCQVIVMPRRFDLGEHYDHHQSEITEAFEARGLVLRANDTEELAGALEAARTRVPVMATTDAAPLAERLNELLDGWSC